VGSRFGRAFGRASRSVHGAEQTQVTAVIHKLLLPPSQNKCNSRIQNLSHKECNFE
jgi:hypothetical protein